MQVHQLYDQVGKRMQKVAPDWYCKRSFNSIFNLTANLAHKKSKKLQQHFPINLAPICLKRVVCNVRLRQQSEHNLARRFL